MNRIEKIKKYREKKDAENLALEKSKQAEAEALEARIRGLKPRIEELIATANACRENGIDINKYGKTFNIKDDKYLSGTFITNAVSHRLGFIDVPYNCKFLWIGIKGGNDYPDFDFRTNGDKIFNMDNKDIVLEPSVDFMKIFIKDFDIFEKAFYEYVDSIVGEE